jgi:hypothetical protein
MLSKVFPFLLMYSIVNQFVEKFCRLYWYGRMPQPSTEVFIEIAGRKYEEVGGRVRSPVRRKHEAEDFNMKLSEIVGIGEDVNEEISPEKERRLHSIVRFIKDYVHFPWRQKGLQLLFACVYFVSCGYWNSLVQVYIQNLVIQRGLEHTKPLFDMGFYVFPYVTFALAADYYMTTLIIIVMVKTIIFQKVSGSLHVARRLLVIHGTAFILRSISISITLLPNPWVQCQPTTVDNYFVGAFFVMAGTHRTCSDCFFSGHSVMIALSSLIWYTYTDSKYMIVRLMIIPLTFGGIFSLISTHFHYTVDVLYGCFIGVGIWTVYHYVVNMVEKWLTDRLIRAYAIHQHLPRRPPPEPITYSALASEFLSYDDDHELIYIVKNNTTDYDDHEEKSKSIAFLFVDKHEGDAVNPVTQHRKSLLTSEAHIGKSKSADLLHHKLDKIRFEINRRKERRAYYYKIKHFLAMVLLRFLIWFESWEDYITMDFERVEEEHITNPAPVSSMPHAHVVDPDVLVAEVNPLPIRKE